MRYILQATFMSIVSAISIITITSEPDWINPKKHYKQKKQQEKSVALAISGAKLTNNGVASSNNWFMHVDLFDLNANRFESTFDSRALNQKESLLLHTNLLNFYTGKQMECDGLCSLYQVSLTPYEAFYLGIYHGLISKKLDDFIKCEEQSKKRRRKYCFGKEFGKYLSNSLSDQRIQLSDDMIKIIKTLASKDSTKKFQMIVKEIEEKVGTYIIQLHDNLSSPIKKAKYSKDTYLIAASLIGKRRTLAFTNSLSATYFCLDYNGGYMAMHFENK